MGWVVNATPRPLYPRERNALLIVQEDGWAPGPVWKCVENLAFTRIRSPDRPARHYGAKFNYNPMPGFVHLCLKKYSHAPHNDISVNDEQHTRRWSHKIVILYYNIIILTTVLQLPTLFVTVTWCTDLYPGCNRLYKWWANFLKRGPKERKKTLGGPI